MENLGELYTQIYNIVKKSNIYIHKFTNDTLEDIFHELTLFIIERIGNYNKSDNFVKFVKDILRWRQKNLKNTYNIKNGIIRDYKIEDIKNTDGIYFNGGKYYKYNEVDYVNIDINDDLEYNNIIYNNNYDNSQDIIEEIMNYGKENNIFTNEDFEYIKDCLILENKKPAYNSLTHKKIKRVYNVIKKKIYG